LKVVAAAGLVAVLLVTAMPGGRAAPEPLPDPLEAGWKGRRVCEQLHDDAELRVLRCTFPPGVGHERHYHARHFGYAVTGGRVRITDANGSREVAVLAGSSLVSDGVDWHEVRNIGDTTLVYLLVEPKDGPPAR